MFSTQVSVDPILVEFEGQGHGSKFAVTRWQVFLYRLWVHVMRWRIHSESPDMHTTLTQFIGCRSTSLCWSGRCDLEWGLYSPLVTVVGYYHAWTFPSCLVSGSLFTFCFWTVSVNTWWYYYCYYYYIRLTAFFQDNLGKPAPER